MMDKKAFCEECRKDVSYKLEEQRLTEMLKGEEYTYLGKAAHCDACETELYIAEVNDYNLKALYDAYRERNGIISLEKILEIPEKYAIGKRPISLLLGWGEQTISRYSEGDMPTKQYSEILWRIYEDPKYYAQLLEDNKANLKSSITYDKSKRAVDTLLGDTGIEKSKIDLVIGYLLIKCEDATPLSLQKALYYVQGFFFAFYRSYLFEEDCEAWIHGPVYRDIYFRYRDYRYDAIEKPQDFDVSVFSASEKAILDSVIRNLCCYSGSVLERFTHEENPWLLTRKDLPINVGSDRIINKELIGAYFSTIKEKFNMLSPADIKVYAQNMFEQI